MFGQNKSPRRCVSQTLSKQRRGPYFIAIFSLFLSVANAQVQQPQQQNRETNDQTNRNLLQPPPPFFDFKPKRPNTDFTFQDFVKNLHGSYSVSLMGPRLVGASNETYNIYLPDVAPIQLYHTITMSYQVNPDLRIGISESAPQNIADGVVGNQLDINTGQRLVRDHSFELYDPAIYFNMPNLIKIPGWSVFTSASFSLSLSTASQQIGKITSLTFQQSWAVNNFPSDWSYGFNLYANPQFYTDPIPAGYSDRQTMFISFGHFLSYRVSPTFSLSTSTNFNVEHRSPDNNGFFHLAEGLEDQFRISAAIRPNIFPMFMSIVGYYQFLFWNPSSETSIVGASFSIGF
jgi:hypothetical protein